MMTPYEIAYTQVNMIGYIPYKPTIKIKEAVKEAKDNKRN